MRTTTLAVLATAVAGVPVLAATPAPAATPTCEGHPATIVGTTGPDTIHGTAGRDVIAALDGNDRVFGRGGNDLVCGAGGDDHLFGGPGNDRLRAGMYGPEEEMHDTITPGSGDDVVVAAPMDADFVRTRVLYADSARPITVDLGAGTVRGWGRDRLVGLFQFTASQHDDVIVGSDGVDEVDAMHGSDEVHGRGGDDRLADNDSRVRGTGPDGGADWVTGGPGADRIRGSGGPDLLSGGPGGDGLWDDGWSADRVYGGLGDDFLGDRLLGRAGELVDAGPGDSDGALFFLPSDEATFRVRTDLASGTTRFLDTGATVPTRGFEDAALEGHGVWTVLGTDGPNQVESWLGNGIRIRAWLRGGDDVLSAGLVGGNYVDGGAGQDSARVGDAPPSVCVDVEEVTGACTATNP